MVKNKQRISVMNILDDVVAVLVSFVSEIWQDVHAVYGSLMSWIISNKCAISDHITFCLLARLLRTTK